MCNPFAPTNKTQSIFLLSNFEMAYMQKQCNINLNCRHLYFYLFRPTNSPRVEADFALTLLICQTA